MMAKKHERKHERKHSEQFSFADIEKIERSIYAALSNAGSYGELIKAAYFKADDVEKEQLVHMAESMTKDINVYKSRVEALGVQRAEIQQRVAFDTDTVYQVEDLGMEMLSLCGLFEEYYDVFNSINSVLVHGTILNLTALLQQINSK